MRPPLESFIVKSTFSSVGAVESVLNSSEVVSRSRYSPGRTVIQPIKL